MDITLKNEHPDHTDQIGNDLSRFFFTLGFTILAFFAVDLLLAAAAFVAGGSVAPWQIIGAIGAALITCFLVSRRYFKTFSAVIAALVLVIIAFVVGLAWLFIGPVTDLSYDGQAYHQTAIIELSRGWNPFYQTANVNEAGSLARWIDHYAKGPWIYAAALYLITGNIEYGKIFGALMAFAACALLLSFFFGLGFRSRGGWKEILLALLIAFSPVVLYQSLSYYVDGQLYAAFAALCALLGLQYLFRDRAITVAILCGLIVLLNIKFTGVLYAVIGLCTAMLLLWHVNKIRQMKQVLLASAAGFLIGVVLIGFNPYVLNFIGHGSPFYPLAGRGSIDLKPYNVPQNYFDLGSLSILTLSTFSRSDNVRGVNTFARLKLPFTVGADEWEPFKYTGAKEGGFGPLFGGAVILAALILLASALEARFRIQFKPFKIEEKPLKEKYRNFELFKVVLFVVAALVISAALNPISSLARYVPQVWLVPLAITPLALRSRTKMLQLLGVSVLGLLLVNNALIAKTYYTANYEKSRILADQIGQLRTRSMKKPVKIYFGELRLPTKLKLDNAGVRYTEVPSLALCAKKGNLLVENVAYLCK